MRNHVRPNIRISPIPSHFQEHDESRPAASENFPASECCWVRDLHIALGKLGKLHCAKDQGFPRRRPPNQEAIAVLWWNCVVLCPVHACSLIRLALFQFPKANLPTAASLPSRVSP